MVVWRPDDAILSSDLHRRGGLGAHATIRICAGGPGGLMGLNNPDGMAIQQRAGPEWFRPGAGDLPTALGTGGVVIAAQKSPLDQLAPHVTADHHFIDVNGWTELSELPSKYEGFCW